MKKRCVLCWIMILFLSCCVPGVAEYTALPENMGKIVAEYEPLPYGGKTLHEQTPFSPIHLSPDEMMRQIQNEQSADDVIAYIQKIGLPMDPLDSEYLYYERASARRADFSLPHGNTLTIVTYAYSEKENDNFAFLFLLEDGQYTLMDCIPNFGQIVLTAFGDNTYLVGKTGSDYQTTRWYHLQSRRVALRYLSKGVMPDRADYHIAVKSVEQPRFQECFAQNGRLILLKQISVWDFTRSALSTDAQEIILFTQRLTYAAENDGQFMLEYTETYEGQRLENVLFQ